MSRRRRKARVAGEGKIVSGERCAGLDGTGGLTSIGGEERRGVGVKLGSLGVGSWICFAGDGFGDDGFGVDDLGSI